MIAHAKSRRARVIPDTRVGGLRVPSMARMSGSVVRESLKFSMRRRVDPGFFAPSVRDEGGMSGTRVWGGVMLLG